MNKHELIKNHGYRIDTRSTWFTLIKGIKAQRFETEQEAIDAALREIADKNPEALRYTNGV